MSAATTAKTRVAGGNPVIRTHQLEKTYKRGTHALSGLDLRVNTGEVFGLIGPDGAGKTTALKILAGVLSPSAGEVAVLGKKPPAVRHLIGYVTQHFSLYPDLSVDENLRYEAGLHAVPPDVFAQRRDKYLNKMGLQRFPDRLAGQLSGGMKQKLALCCALIYEPPLLLLDEPTTGLDPLSRRELWQLLPEISRSGVTIVVATPYLDEAERCTRIAFVFDGRVQESGTPADLRSGAGLRRLDLRDVDMDAAEPAMKSINASDQSGVIGVYTTCDCLSVLIRNNADTIRNVTASLDKLHISDEQVTVQEPSLDDVFVMHLRESGLSLQEPPPPPGLQPDGAAEGSHRNGSAAISAQGLSKSFGTFQAVNNIDLDVKYGEIFGLLGANGAGKTTTIKMLCGLMDPTSGRLAIAGESGNLRSKSVRKQIGYMSQKFTLYDGLTVLENLEFYGSIYEIPRPQRREKIKWVLESCNLTGMKDALVGSLPRGWKQRIAFGAAVMHEPDILFLDEPTAGVDPIARRQLWRLICDMSMRKTAIIVTTHHLEEAEYCHHLALMTRGEVIAQGSPKDIRHSQTSNSFEVASASPQLAFYTLLQGLDRWRVSTSDGKVHVLLDNAQEDLPEVKEILYRAGLRSVSLKPVPLSLEDAFIVTVQKRLHQTRST